MLSYQVGDKVQGKVCVKPCPPSPWENPRSPGQVTDEMICEWMISVDEWQRDKVEL